MKSKLILSLATSTLLCLNIAKAQEEVKAFEPKGKAIGAVFFNYHYDLTKDAEKTSQIELTRAQFGYQYQFSEKVSGKVLLDASNNGSNYGTFIRNAGLEWKMCDKFTIEGGIINTHIWDVQEKLYGYRYVLETQQDCDKFYSSGDLGFKATIKPIKMLDIHAGIYNGEGYKAIQDNYGQHKISADFVLNPIEGLYFKTYYDMLYKKDTLAGKVVSLDNQSILSFFLGYEKKDKFRIGAEYNMQNNSGNKTDRQLNGISAYGAYTYKKFEVFGRFDQLASNKITGALNSWNLDKDHSLFIGGIQYTIVKGVKMAINYRHYVPRTEGVDASKYVYLNFEYRF